jgi:uncharacterized membrane protein
MNYDSNYIDKLVNTLHLQKHQEEFNSGKNNYFRITYTIYCEHTVISSILIFMFFFLIYNLMYFVMVIQFKIKLLTMAVLIPMGVVLIVFAIYTIISNRLKVNSMANKNKDLFRREIPNKLRPAHVRMLLNAGLVDEISMAATILDLVDRGYLDLKVVGEKSLIFHGKKFTIVKTDKDESDLFKYERFLISWFIDECGDGREVNADKLQESLNKDNDSVQKFIYFEALTITAFPINKYYDKKLTSDKTKKIMRGKIERGIGTFFLTTILTFVFIPIFWLLSVCLVFMMATMNPIVNVILIILFIMMLIQEFLIVLAFDSSFFDYGAYMLNKDGIETKNEWLNFKNFLINFTDISNKDAQYIKILNSYLSYSVALNINSDASKEILDLFANCIFNKNTAAYDLDKQKIYFNKKYQKENISDDEISKDINDAFLKYKNEGLI